MEGLSCEAIEAKLDLTAPTILSCRNTFLRRARVRNTGRTGHTNSRSTGGGILDATRVVPTTRLSDRLRRKLDAELRVSKDLVDRVWHESDLMVWTRPVVRSGYSHRKEVAPHGRESDRARYREARISGAWSGCIGTGQFLESESEEVMSRSF